MNRSKPSFLSSGNVSSPANKQIPLLMKEASITLFPSASLSQQDNSSSSSNNNNNNNNSNTIQKTSSSPTTTATTTSNKADQPSSSSTSNNNNNNREPVNKHLQLQINITNNNNNFGPKTLSPKPKINSSPSFQYMMSKRPSSVGSNKRPPFKSSNSSSSLLSPRTRPSSSSNNNSSSLPNNGTSTSNINNNNNGNSSSNSFGSSPSLKTTNLILNTPNNSSSSALLSNLFSNTSKQQSANDQTPKRVWSSSQRPQLPKMSSINPGLSTPVTPSPDSSMFRSNQHNNSTTSMISNNSGSNLLQNTSTPSTTTRRELNNYGPKRNTFSSYSLNPSPIPKLGHLNSVLGVSNITSNNSSQSSLTSVTSTYSINIALNGGNNNTNNNNSNSVNNIFNNNNNNVSTTSLLSTSNGYNNSSNSSLNINSTSNVNSNNTNIVNTTNSNNVNNNTTSINNNSIKSDNNHPILTLNQNANNQIILNNSSLINNNNNTPSTTFSKKNALTQNPVFSTTSLSTANNNNNTNSSGNIQSSSSNNNNNTLQNNYNNGNVKSLNNSKPNYLNSNNLTIFNNINNNSNNNTNNSTNNNNTKNSNSNNSNSTVNTNNNTSNTNTTNITSNNNNNNNNNNNKLVSTLNLNNINLSISSLPSSARSFASPPSSHISPKSRIGVYEKPLKLDSSVESLEIQKGPLPSNRFPHQISPPQSPTLSSNNSISLNSSNDSFKPKKGGTTPNIVQLNESIFKSNNNTITTPLKHNNNSNNPNQTTPPRVDQSLISTQSDKEEERAKIQEELKKIQDELKKQDAITYLDQNDKQVITNVISKSNINLNNYSNSNNINLNNSNNLNSNNNINSNSNSNRDEDVFKYNFYKMLKLNLQEDEEDLFNEIIENGKYFSGLELQDILQHIKLQAPKEFQIWDAQRRKNLEKRRLLLLNEEKKKNEEIKLKKEHFERIDKFLQKQDENLLDESLNLNMAKVLTLQPIELSSILKTFEGVERRNAFLSKMETFHNNNSINFEKLETNQKFGIYISYCAERFLFSHIDKEIKLKRTKSDSNLLHFKNTNLKNFKLSIPFKEFNKNLHFNSNTFKQMNLKEFENLSILKKPRLKRNKSDSDLNNLFFEEIINKNINNNNNNSKKLNNHNHNQQQQHDNNNISLDEHSNNHFHYYSSHQNITKNQQYNNAIMEENNAFSFSSRMNNFSQHNYTTVMSVLFPNYKNSLNNTNNTNNTNTNNTNNNNNNNNNNNTLNGNELTAPTHEEMKKAVESYYENIKQKAIEQTILNNDVIIETDPIRQAIIDKKKGAGVKTKIVKRVESNHIVEREEIDFIKENIRQLKALSDKLKSKRRFVERSPIFETGNTNNNTTSNANDGNSQIIVEHVNGNYQQHAPENIKVMDWTYNNQSYTPSYSSPRSPMSNPSSPFHHSTAYPNNRIRYNNYQSTPNLLQLTLQISSPRKQTTLNGSRPPSSYLPNRPNSSSSTNHHRTIVSTTGGGMNSENPFDIKIQPMIPANALAYEREKTEQQKRTEIGLRRLRISKSAGHLRSLIIKN